MEGRFKEAAAGRRIVGRLETDSDLVEGITALAADHGVGAAWVSCLGAVQHASFAFYDQEALRYVPLESTEHHEIAGFQGNISIREGVPFLHAHATFANRHGETVGGHLRPGCVVWVAEVLMEELTEVELLRAHDERTNLDLW